MFDEIMFFIETPTYDVQVRHKSSKGKDDRLKGLNKLFFNL